MAGQGRRGVGSLYVKASLDSAVHGLVALLSWMLVRYSDVKVAWLEAIVCGVMSMAVDVDHFIAAKSLNLKVNSALFCLKFFI